MAAPGLPVADSGARKILLLLTAPHPRGMGLIAGGAAPEDRLVFWGMEIGKKLTTSGLWGM
jgi:hypothetical protein